MAAYPSIGFRFNKRPITKNNIDVSDAGTVRSVNLNQATVYRITITHPYIDSADRATLLAFYSTNKNNVNTIDYAGDTYDVRFESEYEEDSESAAFFTLKAVMKGSKQ